MKEKDLIFEAGFYSENVTVRCNSCGKVMQDNEVLVSKSVDGDKCPYCGFVGGIMDMDKEDLAYEAGKVGLAEAIDFIEKSDARYFLYGDDGIPVEKQVALEDLMNMCPLAFNYGEVTEYEARFALTREDTFASIETVKKMSDDFLREYAEDIYKAMDQYVLNEVFKAVDADNGFRTVLVTYLELAKEDLIIYN